MKILVTGGAGFIGSNLVLRLLKNKKNKIIVLDNFSSGFKKHLPKDKNLKIVNTDLLNLKKIKKFFSKVDFVYHLAANADIRFGLQHPKKDLEQNALCTFNVLEAMRYNNVKKIVFTSTAPIYGDTKIFPTPENASLANQTSLYGASKLYCEGLISSYCEGFNFQSWIFRFVSILGPKYSHGHVYDFVKQLLNNPYKLKILGDGTQKKSYLHIYDCLDAIFLSQKKSKNKINIFNLGAENFITVNRSAKIISKILNVKPYITYSGGNIGWIGDQPKVYLCTKKIRNFGWNNKFTIENSIIDTVNWITLNKWIFN